MRQAVSSGISLNATRPAQPISLGTFDPFSDMVIFGLSEMNNFRIPFSLVGGYSLLGNGKESDPTNASANTLTHHRHITDTLPTRQSTHYRCVDQRIASVTADTLPAHRSTLFT